MRSRQNSLIGAVILAAGKSMRMGEPKQLLALDGKPLLVHTLENLQAARVDEIVVVLGFAADKIQEQIDFRHVKVVENGGYELGMGSSLRAGLSALNSDKDAALIVLADQPFVRPQSINEIISQYRQSDAHIVVPTYRGFRGNPVLLDRSVFPEVMALTGDVGCRAIFGDHPDGIAKVAVDDIGILLDIDSKQDLSNAQVAAARHTEGILETIDLRDRTVPRGDGSNGNLILVGTEPVAIALARLARVLRFRVTVVDPLAAAGTVADVDEVLNSLNLARFAPLSKCFAVIASRGRFDEEAIEQAFAANCEYVGLVANRKRAEEVRRRLQKDGHGPEKLAKLFSPAGIEIGASSPEEIALSILAEIVALKGKAAKPIRDRTSAL